MKDLDTLIARLQSIREKRGNVKVAINNDPTHLWRVGVHERTVNLGVKQPAVAVILTFSGEPIGSMIKPFPWA